MNESKIVKAAEWAKANGYKYLTSVVKSHYQSCYHHIVKIEDVIAAGKWIPAGKGQLPSGAYCRIGTLTRNLPENSINKSLAIYQSSK